MRRQFRAITGVIVGLALSASVATAQFYGIPSFPRLQGGSFGGPCTKTHVTSGWLELCAPAAAVLDWQATGATADNRIWDCYGDSAQVFHCRTVNDAYTVANDWLQVTRSGGSPATVAFGAPSGLSANGISIFPQNGNSTVTLDTACTVSPTATFRYQVVGNLVLARITATTGFPCTSNSVAFTSSGTNQLPTAIRPTATVVSQLMPDCTDNGVTVLATIQIDTNGRVAFNRVLAGAAASTAWTAAGNKSGACFTNVPLSWHLGTP